MSPFIEKPWRDGGILFTEAFTEEMLDHLETCGHNDIAAGRPEALVTRAVAECGQVLRRASRTTPKALVIDLQLGSAYLSGGEVERWCKYLADTVASCFTRRNEAHLLTENWGLSARQLQEKLRSSR